MYHQVTQSNSERCIARYVPVSVFVICLRWLEIKLCIVNNYTWVCGCLCVCMRMYALGIVSPNKILHWMNTLIIII